MGIIQKIWLRWRKVDPDTRRHVKQSATWITAYLICIPSMLYFMLMEIYHLQTAASIKMNLPEEVNEKNYQKWLLKQQKEGRFLDEK